MQLDVCSKHKKISRQGLSKDNPIKLDYSAAYLAS